MAQSWFCSADPETTCPHCIFCKNRYHRRTNLDCEEANERRGCEIATPTVSGKAREEAHPALESVSLQFSLAFNKRLEGRRDLDPCHRYKRLTNDQVSPRGHRTTRGTNHHGSKQGHISSPGPGRVGTDRIRSRHLGTAAA